METLEMSKKNLHLQLEKILDIKDSLTEALTALDKTQSAFKSLFEELYSQEKEADASSLDPKIGVNSDSNDTNGNSTNTFSSNEIDQEEFIFGKTVSSLGKSGIFWFKSDDLKDKEVTLRRFNSCVKPNKSLTKNDYETKKLVAVKEKKTDSWLRALIQRADGRKKSEVNQLRVRYVDTGEVDDVACSDIYELPLEFEAEPFLAMRCGLFDDFDEDMPYEAKWVFNDLTADKRMKLKKRKQIKTSTGIVEIVDLWTEDESFDINNEVLVKIKEQMFAARENKKNNADVKKNAEMDSGSKQIDTRYYRTKAPEVLLRTGTKRLERESQKLQATSQQNQMTNEIGDKRSIGWQNQMAADNAIEIKRLHNILLMTDPQFILLYNTYKTLCNGIQFACCNLSRDAAEEISINHISLTNQPTIIIIVKTMRQDSRISAVAQAVSEPYIFRQRKREAQNRVSVVYLSCSKLKAMWTSTMRDGFLMPRSRGIKLIEQIIHELSQGTTEHLLSPSNLKARNSEQWHEARQPALHYEKYASTYQRSAQNPEAFDVKAHDAIRPNKENWDLANTSDDDVIVVKEELQTDYSNTVDVEVTVDGNKLRVDDNEAAGLVENEEETKVIKDDHDGGESEISVTEKQKEEQSVGTLLPERDAKANKAASLIDEVALGESNDPELAITEINEINAVSDLEDDKIIQEPRLSPYNHEPDTVQHAISTDDNEKDSTWQHNDTERPNQLQISLPPQVVIENEGANDNEELPPALPSSPRLKGQINGQNTTETLEEKPADNQSTTEMAFSPENEETISRIHGSGIQQLIEKIENVFGSEDMEFEAEQSTQAKMFLKNINKGYAKLLVSDERKPIQKADTNSVASFNDSSVDLDISGLDGLSDVSNHDNSSSSICVNTSESEADETNVNREQDSDHATSVSLETEVKELKSVATKCKSQASSSTTLIENESSQESIPEDEGLCKRKSKKPDQQLYEFRVHRRSANEKPGTLPKHDDENENEPIKCKEQENKPSEKCQSESLFSGSSKKSIEGGSQHQTETEKSTKKPIRILKRPAS